MGNVHQFSDMEGLRIAAEMEKRGHEFYEHAARISKNADCVALLLRLKEDEMRHAAVFLSLYEGAQASQEEEDAYGDVANAYLSAIAADVVFSGGLMSLARAGGLNSREAILRHGIESEKDSILFYSEMVRQAKSARIQSVFEEIIKEEMRHLSELGAMLEE